MGTVRVFIGPPVFKLVGGGIVHLQLRQLCCSIAAGLMRKSVDRACFKRFPPVVLHAVTHLYQHYGAGIFFQPPFEMINEPGCLPCQVILQAGIHHINYRRAGSHTFGNTYGNVAFIRRVSRRSFVDPAF